MVRRLSIYLDGHRCGSVEQTTGGNITFRYDEEFRTVSKQTPLSRSMPLAALTHKKREIVPFLRGLLPDSEDALAAIARRYSGKQFGLAGEGEDIVHSMRTGMVDAFESARTSLDSRMGRTRKKLRAT